MLSGKAIVNLQKLVTSVPVSEYTVDYVTRLVRATRPDDEKSPQFIKDLVDYGAGPRAGQNLILAGKAMAAMDGRFSVSLDDVRKVAIPVLRHRISTNFQAQAEGQTTESLVKRLLIAEIREPETPKYERRQSPNSWRRAAPPGGTSDGDPTTHPSSRSRRRRPISSRPRNSPKPSSTTPWKYEREEGRLVVMAPDSHEHDLELRTDA